VTIKFHYFKIKQQTYAQLIIPVSAAVYFTYQNKRLQELSHSKPPY